MAFYELQNLYQEKYSKEQLEELLKEDVETGYIDKYWFILHDRDVKPDLSIKKAHYHCIVETSYNRATEKLKSLGYTERVTNVRNIKKFMRYLTHKDSPNKAPYDDNEIVSNDLDFYLEMCSELSTTMSANDKLMDDFYEYLITENLNPQIIDLIQWFRSKGKLDYFVRNKKHICSVMYEIQKAFLDETRFSE